MTSSSGVHDRRGAGTHLQPGGRHPSHPVWVTTLVAWLRSVGRGERERDSMSYPSIADHGLIGDPRFDSPSVFASLLTDANHLGLFSEEIDPSGQQVGNFPQGFTDLTLIAAVLNLDDQPDRPTGRGTGRPGSVARRG